MSRIITLTGLKQSGKLKLAEEWDKNENVSFIKPFTDNPKRRLDGYPFLPTIKLFEKMDNESIIAHTRVNDFDYVYFKSQLINDYNVLIVDDYALKYLKETYPKVTSVWVENPYAEESERYWGIYKKDDYDYVFNVGLDDMDQFLESLAFDVDVIG